MSFRQRAKKMKKDLEKRHEEAIESKDDSGGSDYITIFKKDEVPEGMGFWTPGYGEHLIDIVPFFAGENHPKVGEGRLCYVIDLWVHKKGDNFVCQTRNFKLRDPICDFIKKTRLPTDEWKKIAPKRRTVYLVWVHDTPEEEEKGLQIWEVAHWFFEKHVDAIAKSPKGGAPIIFSDPDTGKQIAFEIVKSGTYKDENDVDRDSQDWTGYRFIDRDEKIPDEILDQSFSLDDIIDMHPDTDKVYKSFHGEDEEEKIVKQETEEEEEEETEEEETEEEETEEEETEEEEDKEEKPETTEGGKCPFDGKFGVDLDKYENCDDCEVYDDCSDENEKLKKEKAKEKEKKPVLKKKPIVRRGIKK